MASDTQELREDQIISEGVEGEEAPLLPDDQPQAGALEKKPRAKRISTKAVENRVIAIEQRLESLAEQVAQIIHRLNRVEEVALSRPSESMIAAVHDGDLTEQVRQLDGRVQKIAAILAEQNWGVPRG
jgi:hypothetical protein